MEETRHTLKHPNLEKFFAYYRKKMKVKINHIIEIDREGKEIWFKVWMNKQLGRVYIYKRKFRYKEGSDQDRVVEYVVGEVCNDFINEAMALGMFHIIQQDDISSEMRRIMSNNNLKSFEEE